MINAIQQNTNYKTTGHEINNLYAFVDKKKVGVFSTLDAEGYIASRPMNVHKRTQGLDFCLLANRETPKFEQIKNNSNVNLYFAEDVVGDYVSVSGKAYLIDDRKVIHELWNESVREWIGQVDEEKNGGKDDPRICWIHVEGCKCHYHLCNQDPLAKTYTKVKSATTGKSIHEPHYMDPDTLATLRKIEKA